MPFSCHKANSQSADCFFIRHTQEWVFHVRTSKLLWMMQQRPLQAVGDLRGLAHGHVTECATQEGHRGKNMSYSVTERMNEEYVNDNMHKRHLTSLPVT